MEGLPFAKDLNETIRNLYITQRLPRDRVARELGVSTSLVSRSLLRMGISLRPRGTPRRPRVIDLRKPEAPDIRMVNGQAVLSVQIRLTTDIAYLVGWQ
jgi:hypothetical protein